MPALTQLGQLLGSPLGSFVYYLVVLLAVEAALGMAWGEWRHARREQARRFLWAMVGLTVVRFSYAIAVLIISTSGVLPVAVFAPLERFADTASICLVAWAFISPGRREVRAWQLIFGVNLLLAAAAAVGSTLTWGKQVVGNPALDYNTSWEAAAWSVWQLALIALASLAVIRNRSKGSSALLTAMLVLALGRVWQIVSPAAVPNLPIWERLANLVAYPLVAAAVYQATIIGLRDDTHQLQDISQASLHQMQSLLLLFEACQQISASLDLSTVLENAVEGIARVLNADQCGIALPENGDPGTMRLAAIHNLTWQGRGEAPTFALEYQLTVQQAMRRKKHIIVADSNEQARALFALLGSSDAGPLLVQPLLVEDEAIGAILVGNSRARRPFTPQDAKLCESLADQVAGAIQNARRFQAAQARIKELHGSLDEKDDSRQPSTGGVPDQGAGAEAETERRPVQQTALGRWYGPEPG